ncbi:MAG: hypothetical protein DWP97_13480 [Calditrichaeota bacterium]|nr:MAG: hypothetical protein DWP97_13480 [Calditrichota bacterium]
MSEHTNTGHKEHILPLSLYLGIGSMLLVLTAVTVWVSFFDFGEFNLVVAMIIAASKASLVALFFMHLKYDNKLYAIIFVSSLLFLAVFIIITMFDTLRRDDVYIEKSGPIQKQSLMYDSLKTHSDSTTVVDSLQVKEDTTTVDLNK